MRKKALSSPSPRPSRRSFLTGRGRRFAAALVVDSMAVGQRRGSLPLFALGEEREKPCALARLAQAAVATFSIAILPLISAGQAAEPGAAAVVLYNSRMPESKEV